MALCRKCRGRNFVTRSSSKLCAHGEECAGNGYIMTSRRVCTACSEKFDECEVCQASLGRRDIARLTKIGLTAFALSLLFFAAAWLCQWYDVYRTEHLVSKWVVELDRYVDKSGRYQQWGKYLLPDQDAWGNELVVVYEGFTPPQSVYVISLGPDGKIKTADDITGVGSTSEVTQAPARGVQETEQALTASIVEVIKEEFRHLRQEK